MRSRAEIASILRGIIKDVTGITTANVILISKIPISSYQANIISKKIREEFGLEITATRICISTILQLAEEIYGYESGGGQSTSTNKVKTNKGDGKRHLNIVVVGKSGVGKSSFLNYAAGKKVFETGIGDPVTQSYFDEIEVFNEQQNVVYSLFDTKGLEAGNTDEWKKAIFNEIERRDTSDYIYDWFHTIIYCIDASSKRIQPFEIAAIKEMAEKGSVLVLLTKKDLVTPDILDGLKNQILKEVGDTVQVLAVCNVSTRTRKGVSEASGLEDVLRVSFLGLWEKAAKILPRRIASEIAVVDTKFTVDRDKSDLLACMALCVWTEFENGERYYPTPDLVEGAKLDPFDRDNNTLSYSTFSDGMKTAIGDYVDMTYKYASGDKVDVHFNDNFYPVFACPTQLDHDFLDYWYYGASVRTYLTLIDKIFSKTLDNFKRHKEIFKKLSDQQNTVSEILEFYKAVNGSNLNIIRTHKTQEAINAFDNVDYDDLKKQCNKKCINVRYDVRKVMDCTFTSGSERRQAEQSYNSLRNWLKEQADDLKDLIVKFIGCYESELHAYGQYCLRKDDMNKKYTAPSESEEAVIKVIRQFAKDGYISSEARKTIESIALAMGINKSKLDELIQKHS